MAAQLKKQYGDAVHTEDLTYLLKMTQPLRLDVLMVAEKEYQASYYGRQDLSWHDVFQYRDIWRLENAYGDFKDMPAVEDVLPYDNYPMLVEDGQVFVIEYTQKDGDVVRLYHRSDGASWEGRPATGAFTVE